MSLLGELSGVILTADEELIVGQCEDIKTYCGARIAVIREMIPRHADIEDNWLGLLYMQRFRWAGTFERVIEGVGFQRAVRLRTFAQNVSNRAWWHENKGNKEPEESILDAVWHAAQADIDRDIIKDVLDSLEEETP